MKRIFLIFFFIFFTSSYLFGQKPAEQENKQKRQDLDRTIEELRKRMQQQFERDHKEMEKMLGGGMLKQFEKMFEQMENDESFKEMRKMMDQMGGGSFFDHLGGGIRNDDFSWKETDHERILVLKLKVVKDAPFDIKVEDGQIKIKGTFEKTIERTDPATGSRSQSIRRNSFSRSFQVPADTDGSKVRFDQVEDMIHIILPKRNVAEGKGEKSRSQKTPLKTPDPKLKPIKPKKGDVTI